MIKVENFISAKILLREQEDKPRTGRKFLQNTHLIKDLYPEHTQNSQKLNHQPMKQGKRREILPKIQEWQISTRNDLFIQYIIHLETQIKTMRCYHTYALGQLNL